MCFEYKDLEKSNLEIEQSVITIRVDKLKVNELIIIYENRVVLPSAFFVDEFTVLLENITIKNSELINIKITIIFSSYHRKL